MRTVAGSLALVQQGGQQRIWSHAAFTTRKAIGALPVGNLYYTILAILAILSILVSWQALPNCTILSLLTLQPSNHAMPDAKKLNSTEFNL